MSEQMALAAIVDFGHVLVSMKLKEQTLVVSWTPFRNDFPNCLMFLLNVTESISILICKYGYKQRFQKQSSCILLHLW